MSLLSEELILEKIDNMAGDVSEIKGTLNNLINPKDGAITNMQKFQASCPRRLFKWVWLVIIPLGVANIAAAMAFISYVSKTVR